MPEQSQEERMAEARMIGQAVVDGGGSLSDAQDKMLEFFNQASLKDRVQGGLEPNPGLQYVSNPENYPTMGATAGSILGSRAGRPGSVAGSATGAMIGEGARQLTAPDEWTGWRDAAGKIAEQGAIHGGLEGVGGGIGALASRGGKWAMDAAIKSGLRLPKIPHWLRGTPSDIPITQPTSWEGRFPDVNIAQQAIDRRIPITNRGLRNVELDLSRSVGRGDDLIRRATEARVPGQKYLTAGSELENLGDVPVPSGNRPGISNNPVIGRIGGRNWWATNRRVDDQGRAIYESVPGPVGARRGNQYVSASESQVPGAPGLNPPFANRPGSLGDIVAGPGSRLVPRDPFAQVGPRERLILGQGQMIEPEEALAPAIQHLRDVQEVVPVKVRQEMQALIDGFMDDFPDPSDLVVAQRRKKYAQDRATDLFQKTRRGAEVSGAEDKFYLDVARGYKEALEKRVPGLGDINKETQVQYALYQTLLSALNKESVSPRFSLSGFIDNPRLWGKIRTALGGLESLADVSPHAIRALFIESLNKFDPSVGDEEAQVAPSSTGTMGDILPSLGERIQRGQTLTGHPLARR
jgi:hypothetical protein